MVKVTFCAYDAPGMVGGPASWLVRTLPELRSHGIEPRCLFLTWGDAGPAVQALREVGIICETKNCTGTTEERIIWILDRLRENPPDVFVPNLVVPAFYAARLVREAGVPTVGILHSDDDFYRAIQSEFVFGKPEFAVSSIVCVSRELERQIAAKNPKPTVVTRIPYGVPVPSAKVIQTASRFRLAYVGRLAEEQKQISEVTRAFCRIVREVPGTDAVIFGDGPDKCNVEKILSTEGKEIPVRLAGRISSDQIQKHLLGCDAIVLLSDYEGLPIALLEAMACGVVPICLRMRSGIPELVENGVTGFVIDDRGDTFVNAVRTLKDSPELWTKLSSAARERVINENSVQQCAEQWSNLLIRLSNNAGPSRKIRIPHRLHLPPVHPALAAEDPRSIPVPLLIRLYRRARIVAGKIRRDLLG